jgi:hypothetical protein
MGRAIVDGDDVRRVERAATHGITGDRPRDTPCAGACLPDPARTTIAIHGADGRARLSAAPNAAHRLVRPDGGDPADRHAATCEL